MKLNVTKKQSNQVKEHRILTATNIILLGIFTLLIFFPVWNILVASFSSPETISTIGFRLLPKEFSLEGYKSVLQDDAILRAFGISVAKTVIGVTTSVFFTAMVAYGMSKQNLMGRKVYTVMGIVTMFFSGGMIPTFLLFRSLGLLNNFLVYIIPGLFGYFNMILFMNFFREIPGSLEESARMDGAGVWTIFLRIIMPLSKPIITTIALFTGVGHWNDYMSAKLYITDPALYPLQMKLYEIIVRQQASAMKPVSSVIIPTTAKQIELATIVLATIPIILVYPFLQKHFAAGMMIGSVKE